MSLQKIEILKFLDKTISTSNLINYSILDKLYLHSFSSVCLPWTSTDHLHHVHVHFVIHSPIENYNNSTSKSSYQLPPRSLKCIVSVGVLTNIYKLNPQWDYRMDL